MDVSLSTTRQKALELNLQAGTYGTFAEIGGGQEVARWFFAVGAAAGSVAKTISAYDMAVSDGLYGPAKRYVSRQRLEAMLQVEFAHLVEQLQEKWGDTKRFFAFANTVATRRFQHAEHGRGWIGVRFQARPREGPSEIIFHAQLIDSATAGEQEALGVLGVNLIHASFFLRDDPVRLVRSLMDDLSRERVEIDMIKFSGPAFRDWDNRLMSLQLVEMAFTDAAMFTAEGEVVQPSEVLYKKPILVERGNFRPPTKLTLDVLERARDQFVAEPDVSEQPPVVLAELSLRSLPSGPGSGHEDFLARADVLEALGFDVLISRFPQNFELAEYLAGHTDSPIGIALGLPAFRQIINEQFYRDLPGGLLESAGRLFKRAVKVYVYPTRNPVTGEVETLENTSLPAPLHYLQSLLMELGRIESIRGYNESYLSIRSSEVLARIENDDASWETLVPPVVAEAIKAERLFRPLRAASAT
jgi:hypothetical protein